MHLPATDARNGEQFNEGCVELHRNILKSLDKTQDAEYMLLKLNKARGGKTTRARRYTNIDGTDQRARNSTACESAKTTKLATSSVISAWAIRIDV